MQYEVRRYKKSRFWGVFYGERLIALCVYKKGARIVMSLLQERLVQIEFRGI